MKTFFLVLFALGVWSVTDFALEVIDTATDEEMLQNTMAMMPAEDIIILNFELDRYERQIKYWDLQVLKSLLRQAQDSKYQSPKCHSP